MNANGSSYLESMTPLENIYINLLRNVSISIGTNRMYLYKYVISLPIRPTQFFQLFNKHTRLVLISMSNIIVVYSV